MDNQLYFEDFKIGDVFESQPREMEEAHFMKFAEITGDDHPLHYDLEYCKAHGWPERLAHGLLTTAHTVLGASALAPRVHESMIAFLEQSTRFLKGVFIGDVLYPRLTVAELTPKGEKGLLKLRSTIHNQKEEPVLEGYHLYLVRSRKGNQTG